MWHGLSRAPGFPDSIIGKGRISPRQILHLLLGTVLFSPRLAAQIQWSVVQVR